MLARHKERDTIRLLYSCQIVNRFLERLLANQHPYFETSETKHRRQEEFQLALVKFCQQEQEFNLIWQQFIEHLKEEMLEDEALLAKMLREQRAYAIEQIENRSFQLHKIDQVIDELSTLEKSIKTSIDHRIEKIKLSYHLLAHQNNEKITLKYRSTLENKEVDDYIFFTISFEEIYQQLKITISEKLRLQQIMPHELQKDENKLIEYFITDKLIQHILQKQPTVSPEKLQARALELARSPRFSIIKQEIIKKIQTQRNEHFSAKDLLQENLAFIAVDQSDLKRAQAAKAYNLGQKAKTLKQLELLRKEKTILKATKKPKLFMTFPMWKKIKNRNFLTRIKELVSYIKKDRKCMMAAVGKRNNNLYCNKTKPKITKSQKAAHQGISA